MLNNLDEIFHFKIYVPCSSFKSPAIMVSLFLFISISMGFVFLVPQQATF